VPAPRSVSSQHQGFVKGPAANGWRPAKILVDNDSQQLPLMSVSLANKMGLSVINVDGTECVSVFGVNKPVLVHTKGGWISQALCRLSSTEFTDGAR
jgi:hypothetical protein